MKFVQAFLTIAAAQEIMYGCQVSVTSQIVSAQTTLNYLLQFSANVQTGDYLNITLPQQPDPFDPTGCNFVTGRAFCGIQSPLTVSACSITSQYAAQITYKLTGSTAVNSLQGSIQYFNNPDSADPVENIQFALVSSSGIVKAVCANAQLNSFQPTTLQVNLASSSSIVGATGATLSVTVIPQNILAAQGSVVITVPEYYQNAGAEYMISNSLQCSAQSGVTVSSCNFQPSQKTVTIEYYFNNKVVSKSATTFYINNSFKNPITPEPKYGFFVSTFDQNQYAIGQSQNLSLTGITTPNTYSYITFAQSQATVGQLDQLQINIGMNAPLPTQCFVKFIFPSEFALNYNLYQATGNSFFVQPGQQNGIIPFYSINFVAKTVVVQACQVYNGQNKVGSITFNSVINPTYVTDTSSFQIIISRDQNFTQVIASQTSGLTIPASSFQPGVIVGKVTATQTLVSATAPYSFTITAPTSIPAGGSKIVITLPALVSVSKVCTVTKLSLSTTCSVSGQVVTLSSPFQSYLNGTTLEFAVSDITNPTSVRDIGTIQIQTFTQVGNIFYLVDQVYLSNQITPVSGLITALQPTTVSSYVTYDSNTVYIFSMSFQHTIPAGGSIRVTLPPGMKISLITQLQTNCYRLDKTQVPQKLTCTVNSLSNAFDVAVTSQAFGLTGLIALEAFKLQVVSIINPRTLVSSNLFKFQSLDSVGYVIDVSTQDPLFAVTMTTLGTIQLISFGIANATNGAVNQYTMTITPNTPLFNQDSLTMTFPKEITLPSSNQIACSGSQNTIVQLVCTSFGKNQVNVKFTLAGAGIAAGSTFNIFFQGIQNAVSTRPTSSWSQFLLADVSNQGIATYNGIVSVTNKIVSNIQTFQLSQDTKEPDVQAIYTITFSTNNPIPYSAGITVLMPMEVALVRDSYSCFVLTNTRQNMVCSFQSNNIIKIQNAFNNQPSYYTGTVVVSFVAQNPSSNANTNITLQLTVYDKSDFAYPIDQILSGLNPTFVCNYPCLTCSAVNPSSCVTCPTGINKPIYLQALPNGTSTCQTACNPGFTYNSLSTSNICIPCDRSCATCRVGGGGSSDQEYCLTCSSQFPVYWKGMNKCYTTEQGCPNGSWMSNVNTCKSCTPPCLDCTSSTLCNYCDPFSKQPLLQNSVCVSSCSYGFTPLYTGSNQKGVCAPCQLPCATCARGLPQKCLTCATGDKQFLFGSQCVSQCPKGTTVDMQAKRCTGCPEGCSVCSSIDNSVCLVCEPGLSMLSNECFASCPVEYIKSVDGSTCEQRQYPLDKYYAPFPFLAILALFYAIITASWILTRKQTLLCQNMIAATALVLIVAEVFQFLRAIYESAALTIVQTILILIANLIVNIVYQVSFGLQVDDYKFDLYIKYHKLANKAVQVLCVVVSLHLHRLVYSKLFALSIFHATTTSPDSFYKPLLLYSQIQIASVAAPIFFSNIYYAVSTRSEFVLSNQLQCTNIELILISLILIGLVLFEKFYQQPRFLNFKADHEALNSFQTVFGSNNQLGLSKEEFTKLQNQLNQKDRQERHKMLKQVVGAVRSNKDTLLNLRLDYIMDEEIVGVNDKLDSMPDLHIKPLHSEVASDQNNFSWEGVLPQWNDDAEERLKLLAWMEQQLQEAAERERQQFEKQQQQLRFQDKESMYDNQMFDNVFFSQKTLRVNEFDHHQDITVEPDLKTDRSFKEPYKQESNQPKKEQAQKQMQTDAVQRKNKEIQVLIKDKPVKPAARHTEKPPVLPIPVLDDLEESESSSVLDAYSQLASNQGLHSEKDHTPEASVKTQSKHQQDNTPEESVGSQSKHQSDQKSVLMLKSAQKSEVLHEFEEDLDNSLSKLLVQESIFDNNLQLHSQNHSAIVHEIKSNKRSSMKSKKSKQSSKKSSKSKHKSQFVSSFKEQYQDSLPLSLPSLKQSDIQDNYFEQESHRSNRSGKLLTVDHTLPGPETKLWQDRVTLFKTLMLDCRPARGQKIYERQNDSFTDPTQLVQDPDGITELNVVEDLVDSSEKYENDDATDDSFDDAWFAQQPRNDWQYDNININMRNFNIFSVLGNFPLDRQGRIINRKQVLEEQNYKDFDGFTVNNKGYLINDTTGAIYSKFTFEDLFMPITSSVHDYGELPMPYRLERFNFNPHNILGNFDFDQLTRKPIFLKNKFGQLTDKNFRPVNKSGFLINANEDIISDDGEIKFMNQMLLENGDLPPLYNYQGKEYNIKDIIGQLKKDSNSKELLVKIDKNTQTAIDEQLRPVNAKGYLVNTNGSIINQEGEIIFNFWELSCQEPPKLFSFTEWSVDWVKGRLNPRKILGFAAGKDYIFDLDQKMINIEGYLIDKGENVIDKYGRIVFKTDLLSESCGQDAKIPPVFTMDLFLTPQIDEDIEKSPVLLNSTINDITTMNKSNEQNVTLQNKRRSLFNLNETAQSAQLPPEFDEIKQKKLKKRKLKRQQSTASEGRYGKKIISQYQQYLDNHSSSSKPFSSLVAGMSSAQPIKPVLANRPPLGSDYAHKEEPRSASNPRMYRNLYFNSDANLSMTPNSVIGRPVQINQFMQETPTPVMRQVAIPDNSYAARAESIFNQTKFFSQQEDFDMFNVLSNQASAKRNDSRHAISQQLNDIQEIYSTKKRPI